VNLERPIIAAAAQIAPVFMKKKGQVANTLFLPKRWRPSPGTWKDLRSK